MGGCAGMREINQSPPKQKSLLTVNGSRMMERGMTNTTLGDELQKTSKQRKNDDQWPKGGGGGKGPRGVHTGGQKGTQQKSKNRG